MWLYCSSLAGRHEKKLLQGNRLGVFVSGGACLSRHVGLVKGWIK